MKIKKTKIFHSTEVIELILIGPFGLLFSLSQIHIELKHPKIASSQFALLVFPIIYIGHASQNTLGIWKKLIAPLHYFTLFKETTSQWAQVTPFKATTGVCKACLH